MTEMVSVPAPRGMRKPLEMIGARLLTFYRDRFALVEPVHHTDNERQVLIAALELLQAALVAPPEVTPAAHSFIGVGYVNKDGGVTWEPNKGPGDLNPGQLVYVSHLPQSL